MASSVPTPIVTPGGMAEWAGCWRRVTLWEPCDVEVPTSHITTQWLQGRGGAFVDVRAAASLREVKSFAGVASFDASSRVLTWQRAADFRGPPGAADAGAMTLAREGVVLEDSVLPGDDYREEWHRHAHPVEPPVDMSLQGRDGGGRLVTFVVADGWWGLAVGRACADDDPRYALLPSVWGGDGISDEAAAFVHSYVAAMGRLRAGVPAGGADFEAAVLDACGPVELCTDTARIGAPLQALCEALRVDLAAGLR
jgi:hypothetical protein